MKKTVSIPLVVLLSFALLGFFPVNVYAFPSRVAHPNNPIRWEQDGVPDGSSCHNHRSPCDFRGATGVFPTPVPQPYSAWAVWDCNHFRVDDIGTFDFGHGFINEWGIAHLPGVVCPDCVPDYWFDTSDPWPAGDSQLNYSDPARNEIRRAFSAWSAIQSDDPNLIVGIEFHETDNLFDAEIIIRWLPDGLGEVVQPPPQTVAQDWGQPVVVRFASNVDWWYGPAALTPASKYHFFSTVLHEVGHVVGLDEQPDLGEVMVHRRQPGPGPATWNDVNGNGWIDPGELAGSGPAFDKIDEVSKGGARDLYSIPKGNWKITLAQKNCNAMIVGNLTDDFGYPILGTEFYLECNQDFVWAPIYASVTPNDIHFVKYIDVDKDGIWDIILPIEGLLIPPPPEEPNIWYQHVEEGMGPWGPWMVVVEVSQHIGPDTYRYVTMGGILDTAGQLGSFPPWLLEGWRNGTGAPFATRPPYLYSNAFTPMLFNQTITFTQKDPINGIVKVSVSTEGYILNHTYWDPRINTWIRVHMYSAGQGCGWIFTGEGKDPILGDVDIITFDNSTGTFSNKTRELMAGVNPVTYSSAGSGPPLGPCLRELSGPDGIPGTGDLGDPFGDGNLTNNPPGSSILYVPMNLYMECWTGANWLPLCIAPFPMLMTTGMASDIVVEAGAPPNNEIVGANKTVHGEPWEFLAGIDHQKEGWDVTWNHQNSTAYVTTACAWSIINTQTALGPLDIMFYSVQKLVREDCLIADVNCDEKVNIKDIGVCAVAFGALDEGWGRKLADPNFDARGDLKDPMGKINIKDIGRIAIDFGASLTPQCIIRP